MTNETNYDRSTFSEEGRIEDVKIGTKIWFKGYWEIVGVVIADEEFKIRVRWDSGTSQTVYKEGFNCYWGIVVENKEEQTQQEQKRHKYYDVIVHWAQGGEIQFKAEDGWQDFYQDGDRSPSFSSNKVDWRIKPKTKTLHYRNAMLKNNEVVVFTSEPTLEDAYGDTAFLRWIDPEWKEIEVEI